MAKKSIDKHPLPKRISDKDFEQLVTPVGSKLQGFEIPRSYAESAKRNLDYIVNLIAERMRTPVSNKKAVRAALGAAIQALRKARERLRDVPSSDQAMAGVNTRAIAEMVNDDWLREISLGEFQPTPWSARTPSGPNHGLAKREAFVEQSPFEIAAEIVNEIEAVLTPSFEWTTTVNKRGGKNAFPHRDYLISYLAHLWEGWGHPPPVGGPRSSFVAFCESVFGYVGWDSTGVESSVNRFINKRKLRQSQK